MLPLRKLLLLLLLLFGPLSLIGQKNNFDWEEYVLYLDENLEEEEHSTLFEHLSYLSEHPINLNQTNRQELETLPFLSSLQVEKLLSYLYLNAPIQTLYELQLVEELDYKSIRLLLPFIVIGEQENNKRKLSFNELTKYSRSTLLLRSDVSLSPKKGYRPIDPNKPTSHYAGDPFYNLIKYEWGNRRKLQTGIVLEKDAGENYRHTINYLSFYLAMYDIGIFKKIFIGDYKARFGQGLVMNQDYVLGKSFLISTLDQRSNGLSRYFSTDENRALRGVAATVRIKQSEISLFASFRKLDARVENDTIRSIQTSGLHRTENEINNRDRCTMFTLGGNYTLRLKSLFLGLTAVGYGWNKPVYPDPSRYNQHYFRGQQSGQLSIDYRWNHQRFSLFGETALSIQGAITTLNGITFSPFTEWNISFLQRYYDKSYDAFFARSFGSSSRTSNELGFYIGTDVRPLKQLKLTAYIDLYTFEWSKYLIDAPSNGSEIMAQADFTPSRKWVLTLRFRQKEGFRNASSISNQINRISPTRQSQIRLQTSFDPSSQWGFRNTITYNHYRHEHERESGGWGVSQSISYSPLERLKADLSLALFDTDDSFSAIYSQERSVLYAYRSQSLSGHGLRFAINLRYDPIPSLGIWFKYGMTDYFDREIIGTGLETIISRYKHDLSLLARWKF